MTNFPDSVAGSAAAGPPISGTVYGGHAPIVGAHVYLLQPSTSAYGGVATSLLGNNGATAGSGGFTLTANVNDPHVPTTSPAPMYETTDSSGSFNLTGAYTCVMGQPVYIYAFGGNVGPTTSGASATFTITQIVVSGATTGTGGTATYTVTISPATTLTVGQSVTIGGLNNKHDAHFNTVDGAQTVTAAAPNSTTFSFVASDDNGNIVDGTYTSDDFGKKGTVTAAIINPAALNNSVVQLATLGNCPSSGNFTSGAGSLSAVFMNEVSTVATAYTFQPFTLAANNDAWHIGTTGGTQAQLGIANAANTAAQLYNIQGNGPASSTTADGDGHIANATTPNGNGTVPQDEIDTLADIIAACVDSTPGSGGTPSTQCSAIFRIATDNGETGGTRPTDTATAAINIARFPDGNHSAGNGNVDTTFAKDLLAIPTGTVPFMPELTAAPNDWTLAITYSGGTIAAANALSPHNIAVDGSGNIYHADFNTNTFTVLSPLGVPTAITAPTTLDGPTSIALDSNATGVSSNVWLANQNGTTVSRCPIDGGTCVATQFGSNLTQPQDAEIDASGNIWATAAEGGPNRNSNGGLVEMSSATTPTVLHTFTTNLDEPTGLSIAAGTNGLIWVGDTADGNDISRCNTTVCTVNGGVGTNTENTAIDSSGDIWVAGNDTVTAITSTFASLTGGQPIDTGLNQINDGLAIDGNNTVWVANNGSDTVLAFSATNGGTTAVGAVLEVSPKQGYKSSAGLAPEGIAVDPSGNVWYDTTNGGIVELVGASAPTVTPLSFAVTTSKLGQKPK